MPRPWSSSFTNSKKQLSSLSKISCRLRRHLELLKKGAPDKKRYTSVAACILTAVRVRLYCTKLPQTKNGTPLSRHVSLRRYGCACTAYEAPPHKKGTSLSRHVSLRRYGCAYTVCEAPHLGSSIRASHKKNRGLDKNCLADPR